MKIAGPLSSFLCIDGVVLVLTNDFLTCELDNKVTVLPKVQSSTPLHQHSEIQYGSTSDNRRARIPNEVCLASIAGFFAEGENASSYVMVQHPPPPLHLAFVSPLLSRHSRATFRDLKL